MRHKQTLLMKVCWLAIPILMFLAVTAPAAEKSRKDTVVIESDKMAEINKLTGTAVLKDNVRAVKRSTGSRLTTDYLLIVRDTTSDILLKAEADGNVEVEYREKKTQKSQPVLDAAGKEVVDPIFLYCDWASYERKTHLIELKGAVHIRSSDYRLYADRVWYNEETGMGKATPLPGKQVKVIFYKQNHETTAGKANLSDRTEVVGVADEILINKPSRKAILQGKVKIVDTEDKSEYDSDRADIFFKENEDVDKVIADGNFQMTQPGRFSKADRAVFEYDSEIVTLINHAYVKEEDQVEITSSQIKMYLKVKKGLITGVDNVPVRMEIPIKE